VAEKANELRDISAVKIPQNSRIIEAARMEGDLRENAGYQYAKEEQKMLMQQKASLADLLSRARVVTAAEVDAATVGFGTEVRLRNLYNGQEEHYTILGRWEADPERHVLSMQAPLARQLMGHAAGQTLTIEHPGGGSTDYAILEITNAMASGAWDRLPPSPGPTAP
jgi:transcription elongation factor GreA